MAEEESVGFDESEFPNGLRVLVVDDSVVCLRIITKLLHKCGYQVTPKENSAEALMLLRQNENHFDIVLTNVHMHEIDGFKLLEAGLELDIPVIMVSASDSKEIIMKGIRYGARDYLVKPLRLEEIKNIWQHVYRKKLTFLVSSTPTPAPTPTPATTNKDMKRLAPKRRVEGSDEDEVEENESRSKKERVRWTEFLHNKFVDAVSKLGGVDKAVPKKILEMMGEPDITREKVASHLQKYRKIIKKRTEIEGQELNTTNNHHINHHNNHLLPPPLPHPIPLNHHHPSSSIANNNSMLMGPTMRGIFVGPTLATSNYQGQFNNNLLVQQHGGYPQQPLQVLQNQGMMMQQPRMHLDNGNSSFGVSPNNNSLLTQFNNQHHNYHHNPLLNNQDIKVQLPSSDCFDYNELVDPPSASDQPLIVDPSYDFFDGICPSLLDEF